MNSPEIKVLMTADTVGGVWSYTVTLCRTLQKHGVEIALATMGRPLSEIQWRQIRALANVAVHESNYRLCWMNNAEQDLARAGQWLLDLERQLQPDLVHLNDLGHGSLAWNAPVLMVVHSCVFSWWEAVKGQPPPLTEWKNYRALVRESLRRADLIVTPTAALRNTVARFYGPLKSTAIIANGSDFPTPATGPSARLRYRDACVFAAGRIWDEAKNIKLLASIAEQLPWPVYVAGEHVCPEGVDTRLTLNCLGFLDEAAMSDWLTRASIYAAPAHYEPFGLAILEAARAGCALVLSDIDSLREVWGHAAVYVPANQPAAWREAICRLIYDPPYMRRMATAAWRKAQDYSAEGMATDYLTYYRMLLSASAALSTNSRWQNPRSLEGVQ